MATQQNFSVTLVKNSPSMDFGVWAERDGGGVDREVTDYYPGAMQPARKMVGATTTDDVTIRKAVDDLTDAQVRTLYADQQNDKEYTVTQQRLTSATTAAGAGRAWTGIIKTVTEPSTSASSSDAAMIEVVVSTIGTPTVA